MSTRSISGCLTGRYGRSPDCGGRSVLIPNLFSKRLPVDVLRTFIQCDAMAVRCMPEHLLPVLQDLDLPLDLGAFGLRHLLPPTGCRKRLSETVKQAANLAQRESGLYRLPNQGETVDRTAIEPPLSADAGRRHQQADLFIVPDG